MGIKGTATERLGSKIKYEKRGVNVGKRTISAEISEELYERFMDFVTVKGRGWRGRREASYKALDSAVEIALKEWLDKHRSPDTSGRKEA